LVVLAALCAALPATAQVGYEPSESPYRDIPHRMGPQLDATYIAGGRGVAGVGLTDILLAGVHLEVPFGKIFRGIVGMSYGQGERTVIDPALDPGARALGPEKDDMMLFEGEIQLLITGEKSWNRIAPYLTVGVGLAYGASEPDLEQAGYKFGTKTFVAPGAGVRLYPSSRISIRADFRLILWRLKYPAQYFVPIANQDPVLDLDVPEKEWVRHPSARLAVAWTF
jgi:hypothetical protein